VMLGAMLIAAKVRGIDLGKTYVSAYKLAAVAIAPAAVMEFVNPIAQFIPFGFIISFVVEFALFFALLGALFDMDESDTWYCVGVLFVTRVALYLVLLFVFHA
jgi:predicted small integral membrane protein